MKSKAGFKSTLALIPCLSFAAACGPLADKTSEQKVYGGSKVASGAWRNVVAITQQGSGMYCSGTAVAPNLVITAAHCAKGFKAADVSVYIGSGVEGGSVSGQYQAKTIKASPKWNTTNDIAYIKLVKDMDLPASAMIPVLTDADEIKQLLAVGATGHIVGFGNRDDGGFGVKFEVDGKVTRLTSNEVYIGGSGKDSCNGDSGGPVFGQLPNGEWRVYGVTSRGGSCGSGGIYGLMQANICWVQEDSGVDLGLPAGTCD